MSDFLGLALGLAFTMIVCLLALQALLAPWFRFRRMAVAKSRRKVLEQQTSERPSPTASARSAPSH